METDGTNRHSLNKAGVFLVLIILAIGVASLYGVLHNQITYTVSPEYFTKFKFRQFHLANSPLPERVRASIIGFKASWWMGIPMGMTVCSVGFIHRDPRRMFTITLLAMAISIAFTLGVGLAGLGYGWLQTTHIDPESYRGWFIPENLTDVRRFLCARYMHTWSYLGGVLSIPVALGVHIIMHMKDNNASRVARSVT